MSNNNSWDAWEHLYEEDDANFGVMKAPKKPKVKKMRKEKEFESKKKKRR